MDGKSKLTLGAALDHFIPKAMLVDAEQHRRARMFMLSHAFGPILGNSLPVYLFLMDIVRDYRVGVFFLSITAFWAYPFLLRATGHYRLLAFISIQNLASCVLWACYAFGGLLSPFLPWMLIIPLLSFLYLPSVGWIRNALLAQLVCNLGLLLYICLGGVALPPVDLGELQVIGLVSMGAVAIYFAMMALYFAKMFHEQREFGRELNALVSSSDNLRNLTSAAEQAGAAKAEFIASMSHELRTPLNAIIGYSQLLIEEAADEGDIDGADDLGKIHRSGSNLLYLIDHILDYSRIEAGRMPINARAGRVASEHLSWRDACSKLPEPVELIWRGGAHDAQPLVTDWTALGAIVTNLVASLCATTSGTRSIAVTMHRGSEGAFSLEFASLGRAESDAKIDLSAEIFDNADDVSPTRYGTMGIESALALKYIHLLRGVIEHGPKAHGSLRIAFPPIEPDSALERAA